MGQTLAGRRSVYRSARDDEDIVLLDVIEILINKKGAAHVDMDKYNFVPMMKMVTFSFRSRSASFAVERRPFVIEEERELWIVIGNFLKRRQKVHLLSPSFPPIISNMPGKISSKSIVSA